MDEPVQLDELIGFVAGLNPGGDALAHLADAVTVSDRLGEAADQLIGHFVAEARNTGATWTEIGKSMGVTRQAVQKRFVPKSAAGDPGAALERFTPRAKAVIAASQDEARAAEHDYVGTEHIVLALLSQPEGVASKVLAERVTPDRLRAAVHDALGPPRGAVPEQIPYTLRGKNVIDVSVREAQRLGHQYVGTEHILLAVLADEQGVGAVVLTGLGVDKNAVEAWLAAHGLAGH
ncbi:Clp protease N-terminal domain-containing protein [Actinosynnema sp. NPDC047251]|uniref:ATP-dependent Clp protease n=1 Tax=Saccharothrix espanaensis (strain ATCC 51144 / DSM 44229 / JCM 9112 / NBRC 15066 / NRRL 15764) TaxID=1179773 RepID=K0K7A7_SACES|nr:Clp protease N-terminal domain-containing protein [Saccharothrix espanaensis]CCH32779.1 ATP-dependent Clp protease [Saccharothrix espanaensis DSM 44229]